MKIANGKIRIEVPEGTEGASKREVTNPTNGEKKVKIELCYDYIQGKITNIEYREHERYGSSWSIEIDDGKELFNLQVNDKTKTSIDILCRLPNLDFDEEVKISTYPTGMNKRATGVAMYQDDKIPNFFVAKIGDEIVFKNGYPESKGKLDKDEYQIYQIQVRKFLKEYTLKNVIPKLNKANEVKVVDGDDFNTPDDLPF